MEKYIFVLSSVLILGAFLNFSAVVAHPNHAQMDECKTAVKATDDDLKSLRDFSAPKTRGAKCMISCMGEKSGKIVNNKLNPDGVVNWYKNSPDYSEQKLQAINEIVAECKDVTDPDECEAGYKIMECMMEGGQKRGFKPPFKGQGPKN